MTGDILAPASLDLLELPGEMGSQGDWRFCLVDMADIWKVKLSYMLYSVYN